MSNKYYNQRKKKDNNSKIKETYQKLHRSIEEEEKVPNEHPPKRHSIGLGYYQTNYFS
jgi:hypothetical protein